MARIKNMKNAKKIENPGVLLKRLMGYIMKHYGAAFVTVLICILISVICNVQGTMFMQTLIDDYIVPMLKDGSRDFSGLAHAITRVAGFYAIGVAVTLLYSQIMVNITQGTYEACVMICLRICRTFRLNILIHMHMEISCRYTQMILIH